MKRIVSILLITVFSITASAYDVVGERETIVVEHNKDDSISFKHCVLDKKGQIVDSTCERIGSQESYTRQELADIKSYEITDAIGKIALDAGIIVGAGYFAAVYGMAGGVIAIAEAFGISGTMSSGTASLIGVAGMGGVSLPFVWKKLNPVRQTRHAMVLSKDLINDEPIEEDDKKVLYLVELLNEIL